MVLDTKPLEFIYYFLDFICLLRSIRIARETISPVVSDTPVTLPFFN